MEQIGFKSTHKAEYSWLDTTRTRPRKHELPPLYAHADTINAGEKDNQLKVFLALSFTLSFLLESSGFLHDRALKDHSVMQKKRDRPAIGLDF